METARANLYHLLAGAYASPLRMQPAQASSLRETAADLPAEMRAAVIALADAWQSALSDREALALAYARLFLGPFEILASPYASFYLEPDQRLMGPVSQHVARLYAAAGLTPGPGPREAPDHVAVEWEFMYYLTYQSLTTGDPAWRDERRRFHATHLAQWIPGFVRMIRQADQHPFYDALCAVTLAALGDLNGD